MLNLHMHMVADEDLAGEECNHDGEEAVVKY